jgi:hypothetical protein
MIGVTQAVYIVPLYLLLRPKYRHFATGLLRGAGIVFALDGALLAFVWSFPQFK